MSALDGFYSTWADAKETFGQGTPQTGAEFDHSAQLRTLGTGLDDAKPGEQWSGSAASGYDKANSDHQRVFTTLADLDRRLAQQVDRSAQVVDTGRQNLDALKQWVTDAANSVPPGRQRDMMLMQIANKGLGQLTEVVKTSNDELNGVGRDIRTLKGDYDDAGDQKFSRDGEQDGKKDGEKDEKSEGEDGPQIQLAGSEKDIPSGAEDGAALAEQAALPPAQRDPAVLDRVAENLPPTTLSDEQKTALAQGREVDDIPAETQDYYRDFYQAAGKDGLLNLDRHLEAQEAGGDADAGAQRDRLANGLTVASNENIVERNPDGSIADRGGYDKLPPDLREMLEVRRGDPTYPGWETVGPAEAKNRHVADVVQFSELMGEANPGFQPGSRLGTEMYLKSADMVEYSLGGYGMTDTPPDAYERAANTLADVAGRNNDASAQIFTGQGDDLPDGYHRDETVRTLLGHDWSPSGGEGNGAATLLDWMTEESQRPADDPLGIRAREAMVQLPDLIAPSDTDPAYQAMRDSFARNDAISTEMSQLLAANTDSLAAPGSQQGFAKTELDALGEPVFGAADGNRLLELGSYSEEGRVTLATAAETGRIAEIQAALQDNPNADVSAILANSAAGNLSGRIDQAMFGAIDHQNDVLQTDVEANDRVYRAKLLGAELAGVATDQLAGKIPHAGIAMQVTGVNAGDAVENAIKQAIDMPEYQAIEVPEAADLEAASTRQAQQAIVDAALRAGQLPPILAPDGRPVAVADLAVGSAEWTALQQYLVQRNLTQYVLDYGQSYAVVVE
ncbi:EspA/EspE family type VII secretion system effector [Mycobacterium sp. WMMD1722]|uniref:TPR repeat region-containing protein n=1 Tax=Mycobacterium sp. WMMD1722 TaxID=3404117 RepID=UPI003BF5B1E6